MIDTNTPTEDNTTQLKKGRKNRLLLILLLLSLPVCLFLGIWLSPLFGNTKTEAEDSNNLNLSQIQTQSDSLYRALQSELEFYKTQSDSLYPEIDAREEELDKQYIRIQNLIRQTKQEKSSSTEIEQKMKEMREELTRLRKFVDDQTLNLAEIRRENAKLIADKKNLADKYEQEKNDKEKLADKYEKLENQNDRLNEKVDRASVLQVVNLKAVGAKLSGKGIDRETDVAKKAEFIKVCFDIARNDVVRPGINKFYIVINDPGGSPIFIESRGSGKFTQVEKNNEIAFTTMKSFNYNTDFKELCATWSQDPQKPFTKGVYQIDIYNQGYKVGSTNLSLK